MSEHYERDCRLIRMGEVVIPILCVVFLTCLAIYQLNQ